VQTSEGKFQTGFDGPPTDLGTLKAGTHLWPTQRLTMGVMDDTFHYNADYKVLICKYHGGGVVV